MIVYTKVICYVILLRKDFSYIILSEAKGIDILYNITWLGIGVYYEFSNNTKATPHTTYALLEKLVGILRKLATLATYHINL